MNVLDTRLGKGDSDTLSLGICAGDRVRVVAGAFEGMIGTVMERREGGRFLVKVEHAVFITIKQYFLESLD